MDGAEELEAKLHSLMLASLDGDAAAYRTLLEVLAEHLRRYFARRLAAALRANGEDLVQETLLAIHTRRVTYDPSLRFTAWAYAIARYKLIDHLRRQRIRMTVPLDDYEFLMADESGDPTARLDVERALASVPDRTAALIRKTRIDGHSVAEAAASVGMTETAAKVSIHRGLKAIAARFSGGGK